MSEWGSTWGDVGARGGGITRGSGLGVPQAPWDMDYGAASVSPTTGVTKGKGGYYYQGLSDGSILIVAGPTGTGKRLAAGSSAYNAVMVEIPGHSWNAPGTNAKPVGNTTGEGGVTVKPGLLYKAGRFAAQAGAGSGTSEGAAINDILTAYQSGDKAAGSKAVAGAVGKYGPGMVEAASEFIKAKKDSPKAIAKKLAHAKTRYAHFKAIGNKAKARKWKHKVEMYEQMLAQIGGGKSMVDVAPALDSISESDVGGLPSWAPWVIGGTLLFIVGAAALSGGGK